MLLICLSLLSLFLTINSVNGESTRITPNSIDETLKNFNQTTFDELIEKLGGTNWTTNDAYQETLMHIAARNGYYNASRALIAKDPSLVNATDKFHRFPLHFASRHGHCNVVKLLVDNNADVNALARFFNENSTIAPSGSVLYVAAFKGEVDCVKTLLDKKEINVDYQERTGETALHASCQGGSSEASKLLIIRSPKLVNVITKYYWTPLHYAVRNMNCDVVKLLLESGADVNALSKFSEDDSTTSPHISALYLAARSGNNVPCAQILLDHGANINHRDKDGKTALHIASKNMQYFVVKLLVERGADVSIKDNDGKTAPDLAENKEVIDYFKENIPKSN